MATDGNRTDAKALAHRASGILRRMRAMTARVRLFSGLAVMAAIPLQVTEPFEAMDSLHPTVPDKPPRACSARA